MTETPKAQPRAKALHELLSHEMVDIYVGSENTRWVLHEKLLCYRSKFFASIFYKKGSTKESNKVFGLPEEDDAPFKLFVGWLYSSSIPVPYKENDLTDLFDLYLMGEKWSIAALVKDTLDSIRTFYHSNNTYPSLRRVQYIYANTTSDSPMRRFLIGSIVRMLVVTDQPIPQHWDKALQKNGQLAVDLIRAVQEWHVNGDEIPDPREEPLMAEREGVDAMFRLEKKQDGTARELTNGKKVGDRSLADIVRDDDSQSTLTEEPLA